ncbi:carbonic anhydrase 13-like [Schistocerca gregaria]|uniref:Carbonic anhydrase n=1 Tax=Schistocerca gregaria TaxID=7010 RepID=A0A8E5JT43_SCHGR|nr:carbonic anhydrase 13-like [Schistocerca gregaria]QVD39278.1 Carbonic anhydrase [Schistocerca gregaria]
MSDWGYAQNNGPETWPEKFPLAAGTRQSPVDIITSRTLTDASLSSRPLTWRYPSSANVLVNTGHGWRADLDYHGSELRGGPLADTYVLEQFHCHWGCSEHTVDGRGYAGELHLVHWNISKYQSFSEAAGQPDGLGVLGIFVEEGDVHEEFQKIVDALPKITLKGQKTELSDPVDPNKLLPDFSQYWTYEGSLTTPPCNESVIWMISKQPIRVSGSQLSAFRSLRCYGPGEQCPCDELQGLVVKNYRPPVPLGNRQLRECGSL